MSNAEAFRKLRALRQQIASLPSVAERVARRAAAEFRKLAKADFDAGRTPDGDAWKPGKDGKRVTLKKSGRLEKKATDYEASGRHVRATVTTVPYARFQLRRGYMPRTLPAAWATRLRELARQEIEAHVGGGR